MTDTLVSKPDKPHPIHPIFNKSFITNALTIIVIGISFVLPESFHKPVLSVGLFAFSGAITNWLAVHMLFEKIPFLYGSGVIPTRFEEFKSGIHFLLKEQFFNKANLEKFLTSSGSNEINNLDFEALLKDVDLNPAFESLKDAIKESPFGGMLNMFGGESALEPLRDPFATKLKSSIAKMTSTPEFQSALQKHLKEKGSIDAILEKVDLVIHERLNEMTPQLVKEIIQDMIRRHLGWLVVWGGVFGGLMGLIAFFVQQ